MDGSAPRSLALVLTRAMDALQERFQADAEGRIVMRTTEPALGTKLHILYTARGAGQSREFVRELAEVLADQGLEDRAPLLSRCS